MLDEAELETKRRLRHVVVEEPIELLFEYNTSGSGDVERYLRGEPGPPLERKQPFLDELRREREAGIRNYRVRVLSTPLNDYIRCACEWGYEINAEAGQEVQVIDAAERPLPADLVDHDFWLLDDRHVLRMHYDGAGRFLGAEAADPGELPRYRRARDAALAASEPFADWYARHPEERRSNRPT